MKQFIREGDRSGAVFATKIKVQMTYWHPDKLISCREHLREEFKRKAAELFVAWHDLYDEV